MCKHNLNFAIEEISFASHQRSARNGQCEDIRYGKPFGYNEMLEISHYNFQCFDCGKRTKFQSLSIETPKYLKSAVDILFP